MALTASQTAEVARLRAMTDTTSTASPTTDDELYTHIVREGSVEAAAAYVWTTAAAGYARLVDVTEGSSSRKLSQLHDNAMKMAARMTTEVTATQRVSRVRAIERD